MQCPHACPALSRISERGRRLVVIASALWILNAFPACAQQSSQEPAGGEGGTNDQRATDHHDRQEVEDHDQLTEPAGRLFGVLPNASTVEAGNRVAPITTRQSFAFATQDSFDKFVFPFVGVVAYLGVGQSSESYWQRYATSFADNTIGNYMVVAIVPSLLHQDPRYFQLGSGSFLRRFAYAASRSVITRSREGHLQFNASEIGGNAASGLISTLYYPAADRSAASTWARVGSQIMWDTISFECKEFWPDIRGKLRRMFGPH